MNFITFNDMVLSFKLCHNVIQRLSLNIFFSLLIQEKEGPCVFVQCVTSKRFFKKESSRVK